MTSLERSFGREAFGFDPANYHAARPPYPEAVWQALRERAGLGPGIDVLEIGPGTGLATAPLLAHEPARLVAVEPDPRLADFLGSTLPDPRVDVLTAPFESAELPAAAFDLVVCATAFHWLESMPALRRIHGLLRPGGAAALVWQIFGDHDRADPFHDATVHLFAGHRTSLSEGGTVKIPFGFDAEARAADFHATGFTPDPPQFLRWSLTLDPDGVRRLYSTYSNVTALRPDEQSRLLDGLAEVAATRFAGRVTRNMTTSIYTARRG